MSRCCCCTGSRSTGPVGGHRGRRCTRRVCAATRSTSGATRPAPGPAGRGVPAGRAGRRRGGGAGRSRCRRRARRRATTGVRWSAGRWPPPHPDRVAHADRDLRCRIRLRMHARSGTTRTQQARSAYMRLFRQPGRRSRLLLGDGRAGAARLLRPSVTRPGRRTSSRCVEPGALTAALNWYRAMSRAAWPATGPVTVPTTYVWSDGDAASAGTPAGVRRARVRRITGFVELPGSGTGSPSEHRRAAGRGDRWPGSAFRPSRMPRPRPGFGGVGAGHSGVHGRRSRRR